MNILPASLSNYYHTLVLIEHEIRQLEEQGVVNAESEAYYRLKTLVKRERQAAARLCDSCIKELFQQASHPKEEEEDGLSV